MSAWVDALENRKIIKTSLGLNGASCFGRPRTLYGVFKLCNEGTARIYFHDHSIPSAGLRSNMMSSCRDVSGLD
eukprot:5855459-Amphidinium_carterae.1